MTGVRTDETGLHALDCECARCEAGFRPTELERSAARRALVIRKIAEARKAAELAASVPTPRLRIEGPKPVVPPTEEEWRELEELRRKVGKKHDD